MASGKHLLITSDDFGMCHSVNAGICRAMTQGITAATNLMVPCAWFDEAVAMTKEHALPTGIHLCVTSEWDRLRWGPITDAPSLRGPDGYFHSTWEQLETTAEDDEIYSEYKAQIERVKARGVEPTHLDSHMMSWEPKDGIYGRAKTIIARLGREYGLLYTYASENNLRPSLFVDECPVSEVGTEVALERLTRWNEDGVYHWVTHAATDSEELRAMCSPDHPAREWTGDRRVRDLEFLTDPGTRRSIEEEGFELIDVARLRELSAD